MASAQRNIKQARSSQLHEVSTQLAERFAFIAVKDLRLKNITRSARGSADEPGTNVRQKAGLNRPLLDTAPACLIQMLTYKAERAGGMFVRVDPRRTLQECPCCWTIVEKTTSERRHVCGSGEDLHRDHNAAINMLNRALAAHAGLSRPETVRWGSSPCDV